MEFSKPSSVNCPSRFGVELLASLLYWAALLLLESALVAADISVSNFSAVRLLPLPLLVGRAVLFVRLCGVGSALLLLHWLTFGEPALVPLMSVVPLWLETLAARLLLFRVAVLLLFVLNLITLLLHWRHPQVSIGRDDGVGYEAVSSSTSLNRVQCGADDLKLSKLPNSDDVVEYDFASRPPSRVNGIKICCSALFPTSSSCNNGFQYDPVKALSSQSPDRVDSADYCRTLSPRRADFLLSSASRKSSNSVDVAQREEQRHFKSRLSSSLRTRLAKAYQALLGVGALMVLLMLMRPPRLSLRVVLGHRAPQLLPPVPAVVRFLNTLDTPVELFWSGQLQQELSVSFLLEPRDELALNTCVGHTFFWRRAGKLVGHSLITPDTLIARPSTTESEKEKPFETGPSLSLTANQLDVPDRSERKLELRLARKFGT